MLFIHDFLRMTWVIFLKKKSRTFEKLNNSKAFAKNEMDMKIKCLRENLLLMNSIIFVSIIELEDTLL